MKNSRLIRLVCFAALCCVALFFVFYKVFRAENTVSNGKEFNFAVSGYDPQDIFRGRYIAFSMQSSVPVSVDIKDHTGPVYGIIKVNPSSKIAYISELSLSKPEGGDYILLRMEYSSSRYVPPFDSFYINESIADKADSILRRALSESFKAFGSFRDFNGRFYDREGFFSRFLADMAEQVLFSYRYSDLSMYPFLDLVQWQYSDVTAKIKVKDGFAVLEDLCVKGRPLTELAREGE